MKRALKGHAFRMALLGGVTFALSSVSAFAQQQSADTGKVEEIVVTGSRIATNVLDQPSPISISTHADIEMTNAFNAEAVLTHMIGPDVNGGTGANANNGGVGASVV